MDKDKGSLNLIKLSYWFKAYLIQTSLLIKWYLANEKKLTSSSEDIKKIYSSRSQRERLDQPERPKQREKLQQQGTHPVEFLSYMKEGSLNGVNTLNFMIKTLNSTQVCCLKRPQMTDCPLATCQAVSLSDPSLVTVSLLRPQMNIAARRCS